MLKLKKQNFQVKFKIKKLLIDYFFFFLFSKIGFFGTNRKDKDKKDKKLEKKPSLNIKPNRNLLKRNSRDDPNTNHPPNTNNETNDTLVNTDNTDDFIRISIANKPKSVNIHQQSTFFFL